MDRRLAALLYADVVGYSRLVDVDEEGSYPIFRAHFDALHGAVKEHGGRVVSTAGDSLLAEFASVVTALRCAIAVQRDLADRNRDLPADRRVAFRIGINFGDVIIDGADLYGNGVNVAARLEALAEPGGICISRQVLEHVENHVAVGFAHLGPQHVKNIEKPIIAYQILLDGKDAGTIIEHRDRDASTQRRRLLLACGGAVLLLAGAAFWLWRDQPQQPLVQAEPRSLPTLADKPSIAVLPFDNLSDSPDQAYFAAGLTDDLITELSKVAGLFVIARNSVFAFEADAGAQDVAARLGVRYILDGTVQRSGTRIRINAQLIDVGSGRYLWAERYDRDVADLFVLQDEVIRHVTGAMAVHLTDGESHQLERIPTSSLEAYDFYLRAEQEGAYFGDLDGFRKALSFYRRAIELDPDFADPYAGIARIAVDVWRNDYNELWPNAIARKIAYDAAGRALELDPENARALSVLALLQLVDGRAAEALGSARQAIALKPNDVAARANLGFVLAVLGHPDEAVAEIEIAARLDPTPAPNLQLLAGVVYYLAHAYDQAIARLEPARDAMPAAEPAHEYLAAAYADLGKQDSARKEAQRLLELFPASNLSYYRYIYDYWTEDQRRHHIDGLRKAGLPAWPYGFDGRAGDRLDEHELAALTKGKTWTGRQRNGTPFVQQFDEAGNVAYQSANTLTTGTVYLDGPMLCQRMERTASERSMCGYVYRNASHLPNADEAYVQVSPDALKFFSVQE